MLVENNSSNGGGKKGGGGSLTHSICVGWGEIINQMSKIFQHSSLKHSKMLVTRRAPSGTLLNLHMLYLNILHYDFKVSLMGHPSL